MFRPPSVTRSRRTWASSVWWTPTRDFGTFLDAQENKEVPDGTLIGSGWIADNPTIQNMITANFTSDSPNNYVGCKSEQFDKLLLEGTQAKDDSEQIAKWQEAEKTLLTDFPAWLFQLRNTVVATRPRSATCPSTPVASSTCRRSPSTSSPIVRSWVRPGSDDLHLTGPGITGSGQLFHEVSWESEGSWVAM